MKCFLILLNLFYLISNVASLVIVVQPQTIVGSPTLVAWSREASDPPPQDLIFDLRFVQGLADVGLAKANIVPSDGESDSGTVLVNFPSSGNFVLKGVSGSPRNTVIGTSGQVAAVQVIPSTTSSSVASSTVTNKPASVTLIPSSSPSSSATSTVATSSSSTSHSPTSIISPSKLNGLKSSRNLPAIVGGVIGGLLLLALLAFLFVFIHRRRNVIKKRLTFHKDMMVQRRSPSSQPASIPPNMSAQTLTEAQSDLGTTLPSHVHGGGSSAFKPLPATTSLTHDHDHDRDVERGLGDHDQGGDFTEENGLPITPGRSLGTGHIVPSPKGPRPSIKRTEHTVVTARPPPDSQPLRTQRQRDLADRIAMLREQMLDVQNLRSHERQYDIDYDAQTEGSRSPDSARMRVLEGMQREMVWLRDQEHSPWALGLTDVLPPGHARYMTP